MRISDWNADVYSAYLIAARAAAARDVIGALRRLGQRKELLRLVPGALDQRRVDAMIGYQREAEALEGGSEILREPVGWQGHGNDGNGGGHAIRIHSEKGRRPHGAHHDSRSRRCGAPVKGEKSVSPSLRQIGRAHV